ncbi:YceH family protein [soil metagenome]
MRLSDLAQRILGSLIEKALATPQAYPLSVNALRLAANQTTGRDPITDHDDAAISEGLRELSGNSLVRAAYARRSSTPKYEHTLGEHLEIGEDAVAVLGVLLLRGPQTLGELRQRTERLHHFGEIAEVQQVLELLAAHPFGALCEELPRRPGQKEARWRHLLGGEEAGGQSGSGHAAEAEAPVVAGVDGAARADAVQLRVALAELQTEVTDLRHEIERLKRFVGA